jgi:hypothetical protein
MNNSKIIVSLGTFFLLFALYHEHKEHDDAFTYHKSTKTDSIFSSLSKLENCLSYDAKTIKWRRIFIGTYLSIILIFGVFYLNWNHYSKRTAFKATEYGKENINNINKKLKETRKFILPW